jgi:4-amino-4-deoxy-L-arabinose transferase-like glycosyltransferase
MVMVAALAIGISFLAIPVIAYNTFTQSSMETPFLRTFLSTERLYIILFASLLAFSGVLLFSNLGTEPFQDYDEATYAEITSESIARGDYMSLTFLNNDYFRKPPLLFWLTSVSQQLISDIEFANRLPGVLAALALIPLVFLMCREVGAGKGIALVASLALATTSAAMEPARQVRFDVLISFFITASVYACMKAKQSSGWYLVMGICVACALLTKSAIAIFAPIALALYLFQQKGFTFFKERGFWGGVGAFLLVAAPWHIHQSLTFGTSFWNTYLGTQVFDRAGANLFEGISTHLTTNVDYIRYFFLFGAPWSVLFFLSILATPFLLRTVEREIRILWLTSIGTVAAIAGIMFWSNTKAVTYLIPLYPFVAITIALTFHAVWRMSTKEGKTVLGGVLLFAGLMGTYLCVWNVQHFNPYYSTQYQLPREEYAIAQAITERSSDPLIYTYKNDYLGTIQYYTRLPFGTHPFVYMLERAPAATSAFVVTSISLEELERSFPQFTFEPIYTGSLLSAFTVTS